MEPCKEMPNCLCCDSNDLRTIFDLGKQPLANHYHDGSKILEQYPLALKLCKNCFHVQLSHSVDPDLMFKNYAYLSGVSKTMRKYYEEFAEMVIDENPDAKNIFEIACNDGSQLDAFKNKGLETYGIDPAENIVPKAKEKGHTVVCDYFGSLDVPFHKTKMDIVVAQNVLAHTPDPLRILGCIKDMMHEHSTLYVQTSQSEMIEKAQFDTIYHEHLSFFNVFSMKILIERAGLVLNRVLKVAVHGNSYIFVINKSIIPINNNVNEEIEKEKHLRSELIYSKFGYDVMRFKENFCGKLSRWGVGRLIGYGSSAKGINLIALTGIKPEIIIDNAPTKQNKLTPGSNIPILGNEHLLSIKEDVTFIPLAWNFYDEIKAQIKTLRPNNNDKFIRFSTHDFLQIQIE